MKIINTTQNRIQNLNKFLIKTFMNTRFLYVAPQTQNYNRVNVVKEFI